MASLQGSNNPGSGVVELPADQRERVNHFFDQRSGDLDDIARALAGGDFGTIRRLGESLRDSSEGFPRVSDIGTLIERAATTGDGRAVNGLADELREYLVNVEVVFVKVTR